MTAQVEAPNGQNLGPYRELLRLVNGNWMAQAICVAAELGIMELLAAGVTHVDGLADATGCHAPSLRRLLRGLASLGLCEEGENGSYAPTALGSLLRSDAPASLRAWTTWVGRYQWPVWENLLHSIRTGECARPLVHGTEGFEHLKRDRAAAAVFHRAMTEATRLIAQAALPAYDFSRFNRIVDVGGGYGELLAAILQACPVTRGVLFELPDILEGAKRHLEKAGVADRCELIAGSFFEWLPGGADAYLLKNVIHDWNDERSTAILQCCRDAMPREARLLLVEQIMPERIEPSVFHQDLARGDLNMLLMLGGRERTEDEFRSLLQSAGLNLTGIFPTALSFFVIEAARA